MTPEAEQRRRYKPNYTGMTVNSYPVWAGTHPARQIPRLYQRDSELVGGRELMMNHSYLGGKQLGFFGTI